MKKLLFLTITLAMFASCQRNEEPNDDNFTLRPPAEIYGLSSPSTDLYEIDPATGIVTHMLTFADGYELYSPLAIGHTMYATGQRGDGNWSNQHIVSYNLDTKEFKKVSDKISNQNAYDALGVIDGKLHVLAVVDDIVKLISIDSVTNAKTEVADFGQLDNPIYVNGWTTSAGGFAYDAKNNKIIIEGFWDGIQGNTYCQTVVLDLSNNTIEYLDIIYDYRNPAYYLTRGSRICSIHRYDANGYLDLLDDKYQVESRLVSVANLNSMFTYDAVEDMMYVYVSNGWCSVDLKTTPATTNTVKGAWQPIRELFVVR